MHPLPGVGPTGALVDPAREHVALVPSQPRRERHLEAGCWFGAAAGTERSRVGPGTDCGVEDGARVPDLQVGPGEPAGTERGGRRDAQRDREVLRRGVAVARVAREGPR